MDSSLSKYLKEQQQKVTEFRQALTVESDRGCALFAAAYLDKSLSDLLYVSLVGNRKIEKDLFEGTTPLSAFSSRITMSYYLGLISLACRQDLDIIKKIRNDFAHKINANSFDIQLIKDRCRALKYSYHDKQHGARAHFCAAVMGILAEIDTATITTVPHAEKSTDAPSEKTKNDHRKRIEEVVNELRQTVDEDTSGE